MLNVDLKQGKLLSKNSCIYVIIFKILVLYVQKGLSIFTIATHYYIVKWGKTAWAYGMLSSVATICKILRIFFFFDFARVFQILIYIILLHVFTNMKYEN